MGRDSSDGIQRTSSLRRDSLDLHRRSMDFVLVRDFLAQETLTHFIDEHHHGLAVLAKTATVGDAMQVLKLNKVLSAPVVDEDGEYCGAVSVADILRGLVRNLEANLGEHFHEDLSAITVEELDNVGKFFVTKPVSSILHDADLWMKGDASTNLLSLLNEGFHIQQSRVHHRVYVCDPSKPVHHVVRQGATTVVNIAKGTEKEGQSSWHPTDVVSQLDLVALLWEKRNTVKLPNEHTLEELGLSPTAVFTVKHDTPAIAAFRHMAVDHKSGVAVVDDDEKLIGNVAISDIRDLPVEHFAVLLLPVAEFIAVMAGKGPTIEEALAGKRTEGSLPDVLATIPLLKVSPNANFAELVEKLVSSREHRLYVVGDDGVPEAVITLTDVLRTVCEVPKPMPPAHEAPIAEESSDDDDEEEEEEE